MGRGALPAQMRLAVIYVRFTVIAASTFDWKAFNIKILNSMVHLTFISFAATSRFMIVIKTHFDKVGLLDILQYAP